MPRLSVQSLPRRRFLELASVGIAGGSLVSAACQPTAPPASTSSSIATTSLPPTSRSPTAAPRAGSVFPTYAPAQGGPTPDFASNGPLYEAGFTDYPASRFKAWTKNPPGMGGDVQALVVVTRPAVPNALDQNPAWQQINKALNVNFQFNRPPAADYASKLATIMAGNDLPDIICFRNGLNGTPNLPQFLERSMADLTPYLGGDAASDYPFLAALPTFAWKNGMRALAADALSAHPALEPIAQRD